MLTFYSTDSDSFRLSVCIACSTGTLLRHITLKDLHTNIAFFFCKNIMGLKSTWGVFYVDWQTLGYVGMGILHLWLTSGELSLWNWQSTL